MQRPDINYQDDYYSSIDKLSRRSKNTIQVLGGIDQMINHYKIFGTFLNVHNAGHNTDMQLCSFSNYLLKNYTVQSYQTIVDDVEHGEATIDLNDRGSEMLILTYESLKQKLSIRACNVLREFEAKYSTDKDIKNKIDFFEKILSGKIQLLQSKKFRNKNNAGTR